MAHIYTTWPPFLVTNRPLGPFFSEAGQNTVSPMLGNKLNFCSYKIYIRGFFHHLMSMLIDISDSYHNNR